MEKPTGEALDKCFFFSVKKLDHMLDRLTDETFRRIGLASTYDFILLILKEKDGIPQEDIAQMFCPAPSAIARFVEKLEYKGCVETVNEGRLSLVCPTEQGCQFAKEADGSWEGLRQSYETILGNEASKKLAQTMNDATNKL